MNRSTPVGYAFGVFFMAGVIEFLLLKSPGFEVPLSRLVWASGFYAVPVFVATWLVTRIRTTYALPVVGVPARGLPFAVVAALYGYGCFFFSRDLTSNEQNIALAMPMISAFGWLIATSVLCRLPTRFQSVPGWSIFAAVAVAVLADAMPEDEQRPGLAVAVARRQVLEVAVARVGGADDAAHVPKVGGACVGDTSVGGTSKARGLAALPSQSLKPCTTASIARASRA